MPDDAEQPGHGPDRHQGYDRTPEQLEVERWLEEFVGQHQNDSSLAPEEFCVSVPAAFRAEVLNRCRQHLAILGALGGTGPAPGAGNGLERIGSFRILHSLGSGGMATVYRAVDERSGAERAVKVLHPHLALSLTAVHRFEREFQLAEHLSHPRLVRVVERGVDGDLHYLVMERVYPTSAASVDPPTDPIVRARWAARICLDVCEALQAVHDRGMIHRDVKPDNILIDEAGSAALADFGFAKLYDELLLSLTATGQLVGTPYYMSPEQILARRIDLDARTDIFSLGVVLYELLLGERPFVGENESQVFYAISFREVRSLRGREPAIPVQAETICLQALEKSPDHRYATAGEMAEDLRRFLGGRPILARRPGPLRQVGRRLARRRTAVAVGLLALALLLSLGRVAWNEAEARAAERDATAELSVATQPPGASVFVRALDVPSGEFGPPLRLGVTPLEAARLAPGYCRIVVEDEAGRFVEWSRRLQAGEHLRLNPDLEQRAPSSQEMIRMPAGRFLVGQHVESELFPIVEIEFEPFLVDRDEVTMAEYKAFLDAHPEVPWPPLWGGRYEEEWGARPAAGMRWEHARSYSEWVGKRLLTRPERLRVANSVSTLAELLKQEGEPWRGRAAVGMGLVDDDTERFEAFLERVPAVGSFELDRSAEGVRDLLGGVSEWVDGIGITTYEGTVHPEIGQRLAIGYSWCEIGQPFFEAIYTLPVEVDLTRTFVGIRCARSVDAP